MYDEQLLRPTWRLMEPADNLMRQSEVVETCDEYNFLPQPASFSPLPAIAQPPSHVIEKYTASTAGNFSSSLFERMILLWVLDKHWNGPRPHAVKDNSVRISDQLVASQGKILSG